MKIQKRPALILVQRRNALVEENLDLVRPIAVGIHRRLPPSFELDDLLQAGRVGLLDAATKYRPDTGVPFRCYAGIRIRGAILDTVTRRHWRNATHAELEAACFEIPAKVEPIDVAIARRQFRKKVREAIAQLSEADQQALTMYFGRGAKLAEVARARGVCEMRASQLVRTAQTHLRERLHWMGINEPLAA